jgi:ABC-2 type transport system permease protein
VPNFVPRDLLTEPMEIAATINPVTDLMEALRSLILDDLV